MLLTISTTHQSATDLGYLLHKHPDKLQSFDLPFGKASVFYPEASTEICTVALMLDIDPVRLVRKEGEGLTLEQYVNDRPYVASSFLSVAIAHVFRSALSGRCQHQPSMVDTLLPLTARLPILPCHGGENLLRCLFEPLGYKVTLFNHLLDEKFPDWGKSPYYSVELQNTVTLQTLLSHLYVLIPVLDAEKHYYVGDDEVEKLLRHGKNWLVTHPEQKLITRRYLKHQGKLINSALAQLIEEDSLNLDIILEKQEEILEKPISLNEQRLETVVAILKQVEARRIIDLGCGEGNLLKQLIVDNNFTEIVGVDVSSFNLEKAKKRLKLDRLSPKQQERLKLLQSSLTYRDKRLNNYDAATVIEVIEHLDTSSLEAFERVLFECNRPKTIILTTPNREYNVKFASLTKGELRHKDHRFEWTREEFQSWADQVAKKFTYSVQFYPIGLEDELVGAPTQMGVFRLNEI